MRKEYKVEHGVMDLYFYGSTRQEAYDSIPINLREQITLDRLELTDSTNLEYPVSNEPLRGSIEELIKHKQEEVDDG